MTDTAARLRDQADTIHALHCEVSVTIGYHGPCDCGWPPVVLALADLREVIDRNEPFMTAQDMETWAIAVQDRAIALDAALNREPQT